MMRAPPAGLLKWLRAAGEPSRLRLLALCAETALSVSDMAQALKQSEPRVSRHLKILCESGLLERLRQGQWVQYRLAASPEAASFGRGLLAQLDRRDPQLLRDAARARAAAVTATDGAGQGAESRLGRALREFVASGAAGAVFESALLVGVGHPELLEWAANAARHCTAWAPSRRGAQAARAFAEHRGLRCRVLNTGRGGVVLGAELGAPFDALLLDHPTTGEDTLIALLEQARNLLTPTGRLWIFEPYESLEGARERVVEHPLARLRRLLAAAGLRCERLSPIEADGAHVLAAVARPLAAAPILTSDAEGAAR
jgi:DNA-binding transcriptional ArsR family regulator